MFDVRGERAKKSSLACSKQTCADETKGREHEKRRIAAVDACNKRHEKRHKIERRGDVEETERVMIDNAYPAAPVMTAFLPSSLPLQAR
jgi:hypothetical protein